MTVVIAVELAAVSPATCSTTIFVPGWAAVAVVAVAAAPRLAKSFLKKKRE